MTKHKIMTIQEKTANARYALGRINYGHSTKYDLEIIGEALCALQKENDGLMGVIESQKQTIDALIKKVKT